MTWRRPSTSDHGALQRDQDERLDSLRPAWRRCARHWIPVTPNWPICVSRFAARRTTARGMTRRLGDLEADLSEAVARLEETAGDQRAVDRELARRLL
jgi:hypothetical protein